MEKQTPQPTQQHCDLEDICHPYVRNSKNYRIKRHCETPCHHDTRSRPYTSTTAPIEETPDHLYDRYKKEYILTDDVAFVRSKTMNCKGCVSNTCAEVCQLWQQQHDTAIRNATRNILLDDLVRWNDENRTNPQNTIARSHEWWIRRIYEQIESLRTTTQEHP